MQAGRISTKCVKYGLFIFHDLSNRKLMGAYEKGKKIPKLFWWVGKLHYLVKFSATVSRKEFSQIIPWLRFSS